MSLSAPSTSSYPIVLNTARPLSSSRFWTIPIIGIFVKGIILIPHFLILYVLGIVTGLAQLVIWIPVLFTGRYPDWGYGLTAGFLRWSVRVALYLYGLTDRYPPFSAASDDDLVILQPTSCNRLFAVPLLGIFVRYVLLIPHFIILYVLGMVIGLCQLVIWIPVLFTGVYPAWAYQLVGGTILWSVRVYAYTLGLADRYPPFSFS